MDNTSQKNQVITAINQATNILVTVGRNPSIDGLAAALGLTLSLDKQKKHTSAIFSGEIPHIMQFLHPEKTFESSTASFQDFIISLDKDKADKLRYKVDGDLVKIFITPYHTKLSPADLVFSEGELNIDLIIALGVLSQDDLDVAMAGHGKILHDATVVSINTGADKGLGGIAWQVKDTSGYCEVIAGLVESFEGKINKQIATALLTGIVIATEQFSNSRTSPQTMALASKLLAAGADQQLIVAEISGAVQHEPGSLQVAEMQDIPEMISAPTVNPVQAVVPQSDDVSQNDEAARQAELEAIRTSFDPYMPPPLPNFSDVTTTSSVEQPSNPPPELDTAEAQNKELSHEDSLPPPPPTTVDEVTPVVATPRPAPNNSDPTQFHIPV